MLAVRLRELGAPQVVVPRQAVDQTYWADRVAALTPETRARAKAVATTIRTDGATVAARLLARRGRPTEADRGRRQPPEPRASQEPGPAEHPAAFCGGRATSYRIFSAAHRGHFATTLNCPLN